MKISTSEKSCKTKVTKKKEEHPLWACCEHCLPFLVIPTCLPLYLLCLWALPGEGAQIVLHFAVTLIFLLIVIDEYARSLTQTV